ncbi:hypothetical protein Tco_0783740, partial [Tanacetum coccineum]
LFKEGKALSQPSQTDKIANENETIQDVAIEIEESIKNNVVNVEEQPQYDVALKKDNFIWFNQDVFVRPETPDPKWYKEPNADDAPEYNWFNELVNAEKDPLTFNDLMGSTVDFTKFSKNRLKKDKITKADLEGPAFKLLKGTCKNSIKLEYNLQQCYLALSDLLDWANPEGDKCPCDTSKPLPLPQTTCDGISFKEPYTIVYEARGVVYLNKRNRKRLMGADDLYKFSDRTLKSVRDILNEMLQNFVLGYNHAYLRTKDLIEKEDGIFISQDKYVNEILNKFGFSDVNTARTPMETQKALLKDVDGKDVDEHSYRSMIGSLMYLTSSRPDIMFAVCTCARFQVNPKSLHLLAMKRIFRYLKGQPKLGLWYPKDSPFVLVAYTNSDYAGASLDRKSTTGGCQFLGCKLISWQCKKKTITKIHIDNESTIFIVKNPVFYSKTKHIEIRHHFIRDSNEKKLIQMINIYTDQNVANLITKAFDVSRFQYLIIQALVDKKKVIITEASIRSDLQLEDAELFLDKQVEGMSKHKEIYVTPSHTKKVFANMKRQGKDLSGKDTPLFPTMIVQAQEQKHSRRKQRKDTEDPQLSGPIKPVTDDTENVASVPTHSNDPLLSGEDRLKLTELIELCTKLSERVLALETTKTNQASEIDSLKGESARVVSSEDEGLGDQEDASKQGRKIDEIDQDTEVTLVNETQGRYDDELEEEEKLSRQREEDANIAEWDNVQAMMDADYELAARLQAEEQGELTIEEKSRLFCGTQWDMDEGGMCGAEVDDDQEEAEMKKHMEIVPDDDVFGLKDKKNDVVKKKDVVPRKKRSFTTADNILPDPDEAVNELNLKVKEVADTEDLDEIEDEEVPDEPKDISGYSSNLLSGSDDEVEDVSSDDEIKADENKANNGKDEQAGGAQDKVHVPDPVVPNPSSSLTLSYVEYGNQFINENPDVSIMDILNDSTEREIYCARLSELEKTVEELSKIDHAEAIEKSVQANPKMERTVRDVLQKNPMNIFYSFTTSTDSLTKYELKNKLFDMMQKSESFQEHGKHLDLCNALIGQIGLDEAIAKGKNDPTRVLKKRRHDDKDKDPLADSEKGKKKRR